MHFCALVLLTPDVEDVEAGVVRLLAPFDESLEVEPYTVKCSCVGQEAEMESHQKAAKAVGSIQELRVRFEKAHVREQMRLRDLQQLARERTEAEYREMEAKEEQLRLAWLKAFEPYQEAFRRALEDHPLKDAPDPDCEECDGTGIETISTNPNGQWDGWQIGGRFTGCFDTDYDPRKDPENWKVCDLCGGTGVRTDVAFYFVGERLVGHLNLEREAGDTSDGGTPLPSDAQQRPWYNGCKGTGQSLKWPTEWQQYEGDVVAVCSIPKTALATYAVVTPDGQWHQRRDEADMPAHERHASGQEWQTRFHQLLGENFHCLAVVCDLHG